MEDATDQRNSPDARLLHVSSASIGKVLGRRFTTVLGRAGERGCPSLYAGDRDPEAEEMGVARRPGAALGFMWVGASSAYRQKGARLIDEDVVAEFVMSIRLVGRRYSVDVSRYGFGDRGGRSDWPQPAAPPVAAAAGLALRMVRVT